MPKALNLFAIALVSAIALAACSSNADDESVDFSDATATSAPLILITATPTPTPTEHIPSTPTPVPTERPPTPTPRPKPLQIESFKCTRESSIGFVYIEGEVTNLSDTRLENVTAVATWYTADGTFVTSDDALIDFDPLLPGQTSPFKTISRYNPEMDNCELRFKELFGEQIPTQRAP